MTSSEVHRHIKRFELIAAVYDIFFRYQLRTYTRIIATHLKRLSAQKGTSVLDLGCGTGAFAAAFKNAGLRVRGMEGAPAMASRARNHGVPCDVGDATTRLPYSDESFDLVTGAFLLHGLKSPGRIKILEEAARVTHGPVLWHDFAPIPPEEFRPGIIDLLELMEGSDYRAFTQHGLSEMQGVFRTVEVIHVSERNAWYICRK